MFHAIQYISLYLSNIALDQLDDSVSHLGANGARDTALKPSLGSPSLAGTGTSTNLGTDGVRVLED